MWQVIICVFSLCRPDLPIYQTDDYCDCMLNRWEIEQGADENTDVICWSPYGEKPSDEDKKRCPNFGHP